MRSSDGVELNVVDLGGAGRPIVLLHGLMGRATTWWPPARELLRHGRVLAPDARGHGRSGRPTRPDPADGPGAVAGCDTAAGPDAAGPGPAAGHGVAGPGAADGWDPDRMALDVVEVVEWLDAGPAALVGHSMGGLQALLAAARRPDLVSALVVEDMAVDLTGLPANTVPDMHAWFSAITQPFRSLAAAREAFGPAGDYMIECVEERADGYHLLTAVDDATAIAAHWTRTSHWDAVADVRAPTLLVEAEQSITPPGQLAAVARRIPGARHLLVPGTGHLVHGDAPRPWLDAVHALLERT